MSLIIHKKSALVYCFLITCFFSGKLYGQKIKILDKDDIGPVDQVFVYNNSKSTTAISDSTGIIDLSAFSKRDTLTFTHPGYQTFMIPKINIGTTVYIKKQVVNILPVDIIAEQDKEKALEVTSTISKIDPKTVQFNNPQTSADMLELSGNVYLQKSQMGGGSPIIRGFEANRVLLVVDGVRMNNAIYRSGHLQNAITIDHSILENTEIIYGPNSVIYGSDAIGGVVHYQTKTPQFRSETDTINNNSAAAYARYSTANQEKTAHFDFNLGWKKVAAVTSVTFSQFEDLKMGTVTDPDYKEFGIVRYYTERIDNKDSVIRKSDLTEQIGTGYSQTDLLEKISFKLSDKVLLTLNTQYSTSSDIPRYDQLTDFSSPDQPNWAEWYYGPQNRLLTSLSTQVLSENKLYNKMVVLAHYQKIDEDRITRRFGSDERTTREEDVSVYGINVDFVKSNQNKSQWYYGLEAIHNIVESNAHTQNILTGATTSASTRYPDDGSTLSSGAAYLTFKNNFTEKATYSFGARYSYTALKANFTDTTFVKLPFSEISNNNSAVTGNLGLAFHPNEKLKLHLALSTGYRNPNVDDVGKVFAKDDYVMVPNDFLKPELAYNAELGITKSFGDEQLIINAVGFYTILKDAIVRDFYSLNGFDSLDYDGETLRIQTNVNATEAVVYGISFNLFAKLSKEFSLKSNLNYTVGENTSLNVPLAHIPPIYGRTDLIVNSDPLIVSVYVKHQAWKWISDYSPFGEDNEDKATVNGTPAWQTYNLSAALKLSESFTIQAALENMLDVHYRPFASGISGPGRNFIFTLRADI